MKAFPAYEYQKAHGQMMAVGGMDLRDYFAAKAMQGMMEGSLNPSALRAIALVAYQIADQMIEVREL